MRISEAQADFFKDAVQMTLPGADVYLFGSRARVNQKGGDIDILVLGDRKLTHREIRSIKSCQITAYFSSGRGDHHHRQRQLIRKIGDH